MPWKEQLLVDQREEFVMQYLSHNLSMSELCRQREVSRKTGYKWVQRFLDGGAPALLNRSRVPQMHPNAVNDSIVDAVIALKTEHPSWGPKKLKARLAKIEPQIHWPSESTFARILRREGLVERRRHRRRTPASEHRLAVAHAPNDIWCVDFKGKFRVGGKYCHPLTVTDAWSRFVLCCHDTGGERLEPTKAAFERTFREYGVPLRIRSDNGTPFASTALGGLSRLSVWWVKLGILPERTRPAHPQDNGMHERMHRTLKAETAKPPSSSLAKQQLVFDQWRHEFNTIRPHESLKMATPGSVYHSATRRMPDELEDPEYPSHFEVLRVNKMGGCSLNGKRIRTSDILQYELVGLEPVDDGQWQLWFGPVFLGKLTEHSHSKLTLAPNKPYKKNQ